MGTFNANILPTSSGLSLGNPSQAWNAVLNTLNVLNLYQSVGFSSTPAFTNSNQLTLFDMTLTGNVTASTLSGVKGVVAFILRQDATGGRTFAWPANVFGGTVIGSSANQITVQFFAFDGTNAYNIGAAGIYP
jgi:hypothetical protein